MIICYTDRKDDLSEKVTLFSEAESFFIGDIKLLLSEENLEYWENIFGCTAGLHEIDGYEFFVNGTEDNGCIFVDTDNYEYRVSSGCIGVVPLELCSHNVNTCYDIRNIQSKSLTVQTVRDKAIYVVYNNGDFTVSTSFDDVLVMDEQFDEEDFDFDFDNDEDFDCMDCLDVDDFDCMDIMYDTGNE